MNGLSFQRIESINRMIADLYNANLPIHNRIVNFFNILVEEVQFDKATLFFFYKDKAGEYKKHSSININLNEQRIRGYDENYCRVDYTLPILDNTTPIIFRSFTFFDQAMVETEVYYNEYLIPNNCIYSIEGNLSLKSTIGLRGAFCFFRGAEKNDFTEHDVQIIKLFQLHLSNILKYYGEETDSTNMNFMLDYNCAGICVLNQDYQIIRSNVAFDKLTTQYSLEGERRNALFYKAIQLCKSLTRDKNINKLTYEHKIDDEPVFLEITRIGQNEDRKDAHYCCVIYDLSHFFMQSLNQAKDKYSLTPREFAVLKSTIMGLTNEEISKELFISVPTIKKHLVSIYDKMDIKSQKQIFQKLNLL